MGFYGDRILPHFVDVVCGTKMTYPLRERTCAGLRGQVVEIGFGSGLNVPFYPSSVAKVSAVEPADAGWKIAADRLAAATVPVERAGLDGQSLPFPDNTFDTALSTFTLCTIPDAAAALQEVRRVLKPGGTFHFAEHGSAPDAPVRAWQRRLNPIQRRIAGGCHLDREIVRVVTDAGFETRELDVFYLDGSPKAMGAMTLGVATCA